MPWLETSKLDSKYQCAFRFYKRLKLLAESYLKLLTVKSRSFLCWEFSIQKSGVDKFFGHAILLARLIGHVKNVSSILKCPSDQDATRNIAFCSLLTSFLMCFNQKFSQWGFISPNVVLTSEIRCSSEKDSHNSNSSV